MPLSTPAPRAEIHQRQIECRGYRREDGRWDIEGHLTDTKTYAFSNRYRGEVAAGEPVHEMWLRLTIDETMKIHAVEAATEHGPFPICPAITPRFRLLEGLTIGPGWTRAVRKRLGGRLGCTHLVELLGPLATTAYQTLVGQRSRAEEKAIDAGQRPALLDTCHALASDSPVVRDLWPRFHTGGRE